MIKDKKVNGVMCLGFSKLDKLRVVFSYEAFDGEIWCEVEEVYRGTDPLDLMPYLSDDLLNELEKQICHAQGDE
tara:strand:+ start:274 stop:495 length:222 start_codon:yes stop_codon:yes gene_type:complete